MVQLSHLYGTAEKTIALAIGTFVNKTVSLLFNMLCVFVRASFVKHLFLFLAALALYCSAGFSLVMELGLLIVAASLVAIPGL